MTICLRKAMTCLRIQNSKVYFLNRVKNRNGQTKGMALSYWERVGAGAVGGAIVAIAVTNYDRILERLGSGPSAILSILAIFVGVLIIFYGRYGELPI